MERNRVNWRKPLNSRDCWQFSELISWETGSFHSGLLKCFFALLHSKSILWYLNSQSRQRILNAKQPKISRDHVYSSHKESRFGFSREYYPLLSQLIFFPYGFLTVIEPSSLNYNHKRVLQKPTELRRLEYEQKVEDSSLMPDQRSPSYRIFHLKH